MPENVITICHEFTPRNCSLNSDGTLCINPDCHYREYAVGFAFEGALIFL